MDKQQLKEKSIEKLDLEFKQILCIIRQRIPFINSQTYLTQCRLWLEKLSNSKVDEVRRNLYLAELCRQIQTNQLLPPFDQIPPEETLDPLERFIDDEETRVNLLANNKSNSWISISDPALSNSNLFSKSHSQDNNKIPSSMCLTTENKKKLNCSGFCCGEPGKLLLSNNSSRKSHKLKVTNKMRALEEDSSWSDVTVGSLVSDFKTESYSIKDGQYLLNESSSLKPNEFKNSDYISKDWKQTIATLQLRLSEMIYQNNELNSKIIKLDMMENEKMKNSTNYEQKVSEIKYQYDEILIKKDNEISRLSEIIQDQCLRILNEISSLRNQIANCTCEKKNYQLKKCVSKMAKGFQKSERKYQKQIEQLRHELELKKNVSLVQLRMRKAELIAEALTEQKEEYEEILNTLEVKYIEMLEAHEQQVMRMKEQDEKKFRLLTELLEKNGINYKK